MRGEFDKGRKLRSVADVILESTTVEVCNDNEII